MQLHYRPTLSCRGVLRWGAGVVICLERGAVDLHMAQLMPLPLTVFCFSKIQTGFTFLVPPHPSGPGQRAVKRAFVFELSLTCCTTCFPTVVQQLARFQAFN